MASEWTPTDREIREFFADGVNALYSLTAHPDLEDAGAAFDRWIAKHDQRIASRTTGTQSHD